MSDGTRRGRRSFSRRTRPVTTVGRVRIGGDRSYIMRARRIIRYVMIRITTMMDGRSCDEKRLRRRRRWTTTKRALFRIYFFFLLPVFRFDWLSGHGVLVVLRASPPPTPRPNSIFRARRAPEQFTRRSTGPLTL